ncbi:MAG: 6-carboxytetrahydropterin synthase QueD [Chloroflexota bacterium]|nr:6-carboxytetrahydropterin synthase QueD [Chloroflexota bacterium]
MYTICKEFNFSASHQLDHLPPEHRCARLHGHNYTVQLVLASQELDQNGFVVDFGDLAPLKRFIDEELDHRHLNDVMPCPTTSEHLAKWLFDKACALWPQVIAVRVSETPKTWAEYRLGNIVEGDL